MSVIQTDADLTKFVEAHVPEDGVLKMRTFAVPTKAKFYDVGGGPIPLRCQPGDIRCGIMVFNAEDEPVIGSVVETDAGISWSELEPDFNYCLGHLIEQSTEGFAQ